jgi:Sigma-70 region 2
MLPEADEDTRDPASHRLRKRVGSLGRSVRAGEGCARHGLIAVYVPGAPALAPRYGQSEPADDLIQMALLGLVKAVDRWEPDRGTRVQISRVLLRGRGQLPACALAPAPCPLERVPDGVESGSLPMRRRGRDADLSGVCANVPGLERAA